MPIDELIRLAKPPSGVRARTDDDWRRIESEHGLSFPSDYKKLINVYGACAFFDFLEINSPFAKRSLIDRQTEIRRVCGGATELFPDPGGLLVCGGDENMNLLMWRTDPSVRSEDWCIRYTQSNFLYAEDYQCSLMEFLIQWLPGKAGPEWIPSVAKLRLRCGPVVTTV